MRVRCSVVVVVVTLVATGCSSSPARRHPARRSAAVAADGAAAPATAPVALVPNPYRDVVAHGKAARVIRAARSQMNVKYVYGAQPRSPEGLKAIGLRPHRRGGFDCSSFVAYAFEAGIGEWVSGSIAHTDQIWTQGGQLPLNMTPGQTDQVVRGVGAHPPRGGYRPGDILLLRWGAGGYFGHTVLVSEHGLVIQSLPPGVYETTPLTAYLADPAQLGWVRVRALSRT